MHANQLRRRGVLLWEDKIFEGDSHDVLSLKPTVREDLDKVLRGKGLEKRNKEGEVAIDADIALAYRELLVVEDLLRVPVLDEDPKGLRPPVESAIPEESFVRLDL